MTSIVFDIDGTLTNTTKVDDKCFTRAFNSVFGINIEDQDWAELTNVTDWGITEEIIFKNWNRVPNEAEYKEMILAFLAQLKLELSLNKKQFQEIHGAFKFINFLKEKHNIAVGIATGGWEKPATLKLESIGINPGKFVFSNSNHFKTREDILSSVIQSLNEKWHNHIDRVIYFGDGTWDFITCKKLRIEFVGIDNSENNKLKNLGVQRVFKDFQNYELIYESLGLQG